MGDQRWIGQTPLVVSPRRISWQRTQRQPVFSNERLSETPVTIKQRVQANAAVILHDSNVGLVGLTDESKSVILTPVPERYMETNSPAYNCTVGHLAHRGSRGFNAQAALTSSIYPPDSSPCDADVRLRRGRGRGAYQRRIVLKCARTTRDPELSTARNIFFSLIRNPRNPRLILCTSFVFIFARLFCVTVLNQAAPELRCNSDYQ